MERKLNQTNPGVMMAPTWALSVMYMSHFHCLHFGIHPLLRFKIALNSLDNSVNLNNNVGKYNGRNEYDCKNENWHYMISG